MINSKNKFETIVWRLMKSPKLALSEGAIGKNDKKLASNVIRTRPL